MRILFAAIAAASIPVLCSAADEPAINVKLSGKWSATAPDSTEVAYTFSKDGSVLWHVSDPNFTHRWPNGLKAKYQISVAKPLWQIDMFEFDDAQFKGIQLRGIVEILDDRTFKMDGQPSHRADRPKEFGKDTLVFHARKPKETQERRDTERKGR